MQLFLVLNLSTLDIVQLYSVLTKTIKIVFNLNKAKIYFFEIPMTETEMEILRM